MNWTPTQTRILTILADGLPHTRRELHAVLPDDLGGLGNLWWHIHQIRRRLPPGEALVCELYRGTIHYRHVRLLAMG